jgi:hypothetical protein
MLFLILIPVILSAILLYQYIFFTRVYYIGKSLHKFRELRCEIVLSLSENVKSNLAITEAIEHQLFLLKLDGIITYFDQLAPSLFQFKAIKTIYLNILFSSEKLACQSNKHPILLQYKGKVKDCMLTALKAVPFLRLRSFLFFYRIIAMLSIKLGFSKFKKRLRVLEKLSQIEKETHNKGIPCNS